MVSAITLDRDRFSPAVLDGLSKLSHVEVLFHLHGVDESSIITGRKHPRGNVKRPEVGIVAQRRVWEATTMNATAKELTA